MNTSVTAAVVMCVVVGLIQAQTVLANDAATVRKIKRLEHEMAEAAKAGDASKFEQILADEWTAIGTDGNKFTKAALLSGYRSGKVKMQAFELGTLDVKVLGDVAVVQGSDTEHSAYDGNDSSGTYVWTSVFVKRGRTWVVVCGQVHRLK
jgi:ketosteroid isomerase-like protein